MKAGLSQIVFTEVPEMQPTQTQSLGVAFGLLIAFQGSCPETGGLVVFPYGADLFGGLVPWHAFGVFIICVGCWIAWAFLYDRRTGVRWVSAMLIPVGGGIFVFVTFIMGDFHIFALTGTLSGVGVIICDHTLRRDGPR